MNARQNNGALSTRDTDNPMLIGDELAIPHERGDVTALGARQVKVPNAHRAVAATNNGEQVCVHSVHGTHCRPPAEWAQPDSGALWTTDTSVSLWPPGPIEVSPMS